MTTNLYICMTSHGCSACRSIMSHSPFPSSGAHCTFNTSNRTVNACTSEVIILDSFVTTFGAYHLYNWGEPKRAPLLRVGRLPAYASGVDIYIYIDIYICMYSIFRPTIWPTFSTSGAIVRPSEGRKLFS